MIGWTCSCAQTAVRSHLTLTEDYTAREPVHIFWFPAQEFRLSRSFRHASESSTHFYCNQNLQNDEL